MSDKPYITIGDLSRQAGVTLRTIRWYTEAGLLVTMPGKGKRAWYEVRAVSLVSRIQMLADSGLSLVDIKMLMNEAATGRTAGKWLTMRLRSEIETRRRIIYEKECRLKTAREELDRILDQTKGCPACPAQGPEQECKGCGNLMALKSGFIC